MAEKEQLSTTVSTLQKRVAKQERQRKALGVELEDAREAAVRAMAVSAAEKVSAADAREVSCCC